MTPVLVRVMLVQEEVQEEVVVTVKVVAVTGVAVLYLSVSTPRLLCASSPTYESFWPMPTITPAWRHRPTTVGKTARGASSPAKPAFTMPEPLSHTRAATSSSAIVSLACALL